MSTDREGGAHPGRSFASAATYRAGILPCGDRFDSVSGPGGTGQQRLGDVPIRPLLWPTLRIDRHRHRGR